jgi:membrane fusion protein, multidrug efflux system
LGSRVRRGEIVAIVKHTDPVYQYAPLNVIASVAGVVNEVQVTAGSLVNKGDAIVTITDPDQLRITLEVAAVDLKMIRAGLIGDITISGFPTFKAEVQGVSPSVDPMLGTAACELKISSNDQKKIAPGMVGSVQFHVNQRIGYLLPDYAVVYRGDNTFVQVVEKGVTKRIAVQIGERRQGQVEIMTGLKDGDQVIDRASRFITEGEPVQVESAHE